jgi:hypothetical protein
MNLNGIDPLPKTLLSLTHWPSIDFFCFVAQLPNIVIESKEYFEKQSYRNRFDILMSNGVFGLTIPVKNGRKKLMYEDIEIDYDQKWQKNYLSTLQTAYGKSPFYEFFEEDIKAIIYTDFVKIFELNQKILTFCLINLKLPTSKISYSSVYISANNQDFNCYRKEISEKNQNNNLTFFQQMPYLQTFGNEFVHNLSVLDLLCNIGPEAKHYLAIQQKNEH